MKLELSLEEAHFLRKHLARHIQEVDDELVHTSTRVLQHELANDVQHLKNIERQLVRLIDAMDTAA